MRVRRVRADSVSAIVLKRDSGTTWKQQTYSTTCNDSFLHGPNDVPSEPPSYVSNDPHRTYEFEEHSYLISEQLLE